MTEAPPLLCWPPRTALQASTPCTHHLWLQLLHIPLLPSGLHGLCSLPAHFSLIPHSPHFFIQRSNPVTAPPLQALYASGPHSGGSLLDPGCPAYQLKHHVLSRAFPDWSGLVTFLLAWQPQRSHPPASKRYSQAGAESRMGHSPTEPELQGYPCGMDQSMKKSDWLVGPVLAPDIHGTQDPHPAGRLEHSPAVCSD